MEYRRQTHKERGYDTEQHELNELRDYVQLLMGDSAPAQMVDYLVIYANICEFQALLCSHPDVAAWYTRTAQHTRAMLELITAGPTMPKANKAYEHQHLYYPDMEVTH